MSAVPATTSPAPQVSYAAGAVARMLDIPPSTLRGWHRRYRLRPGGEQAGRHRRYTSADVDAMARMRRLIADGVTAASAAELAFHSAGEPDGARAEQVIEAAVRLDADTLVSLVETHLIAHGVVDTWEQLCRPALHAFGGQDTTAAERCIDVVHLLSWAITVALHRVPTAAGPAGRSVLLACVEGERHTLALEALRAALAQRGVVSRLLGANVPATALRAAAHRGGIAPGALMLWAEAAQHTISPELELATLPPPGTRLVLGFLPYPAPCRATGDAARGRGARDRAVASSTLIVRHDRTSVVPGRFKCSSAAGCECEMGEQVGAEAAAGCGVYMAQVLLDGSRHRRWYARAGFSFTRLA